MRCTLGLEKEDENDLTYLVDLLGIIDAQEIDYTAFLRT